jgi:hypothetical protein
MSLGRKVKPEEGESEFPRKFVTCVSQYMALQDTRN